MSEFAQLNGIITRLNEGITSADFDVFTNMATNIKDEIEDNNGDNNEYRIDIFTTSKLLNNYINNLDLTSLSDEERESIESESSNLTRLINDITTSFNTKSSSLITNKLQQLLQELDPDSDDYTDNDEYLNTLLTNTEKITGNDYLNGLVIEAIDLIRDNEEDLQLTEQDKQDLSDYERFFLAQIQDNAKREYDNYFQDDNENLDDDTVMPEGFYEGTTEINAFLKQIRYKMNGTETVSLYDTIHFVSLGDLVEIVREIYTDELIGVPHQDDFRTDMWFMRLILKAMQQQTRTNLYGESRIIFDLQVTAMVDGTNQQVQLTVPDLYFIINEPEDAPLYAIKEKTETIKSEVIGRSTDEESQTVYTFYNTIYTLIEDDVNSKQEKQIQVKEPKPLDVKESDLIYTINVDSRKRANKGEPSSSFSWILDNEIPNAKSLKLKYYNIPKTWNNITNRQHNNLFGIEYNEEIVFRYYNVEGYSHDEFVTNFNNRSPHLFKSGSDNSTYKNWMGENIVTSVPCAGMSRDGSGKHRNDFTTKWNGVSWNISYVAPAVATPYNLLIDGSKNGVDQDYDISFINSAGRYNYVVIREGVTNSITRDNVRELGDANLYFLVKQSTDLNNTSDGAELVAALNKKQPIDFSYVQQQNTQSHDPQRYHAMLNEIKVPGLESNHQARLLNEYKFTETNYNPLNSSKHLSYEQWSSFKDVSLNGSDKIITKTPLMQQDIAYLWQDISDINISLVDSGDVTDPNPVGSIQSSVTDNPLYWQTNWTDISCNFVNIDDDANNPDDVSYVEVRFTPKPGGDYEIKRKVYFRLKEGYYGTDSILARAINDLSPSKLYAAFKQNQQINSIHDNVIKREQLQQTFENQFINNDTGEISPINDNLANIKVYNVNDLLDRIVDYDLSDNVTQKGEQHITSHDLVLNAYNPKYNRDNKFNTIGWNFTVVNGEPIAMDISSDVSFIFYDDTMKLIMEGRTSSCPPVSSGSHKISSSLTPNTKLLGNMLGYKANIAGGGEGAQNIISKSAQTTTAINLPDLRNISEVKICIDDFAPYSVKKNEVQSFPSYITNVVSIPSYYNELSEEEKCGAIVARNLTEAQIYTIGSAIDSQAALNTAYRNIVTNNTNPETRTEYAVIHTIKDSGQTNPGTSKIDAVYKGGGGTRNYTNNPKLTKFRVDIVDGDNNVIDFNGIEIDLELEIKAEVKY